MEKFLQYKWHFFIGIIITISIFIGMKYYSIQSIKTFENRTLFEVKKNEGLPFQALYNVKRRFVGGEKLLYKYTGECEKELVNKYSTEEKSIKCTEKYIKKIENIEIYGDLKRANEDFLYCIKKDKNLLDVINKNAKGLENPLNIVSYPIQCQENKEDFIEKIKNLSQIFYTVIMMFFIALILKRKNN